jgi:hypothetical protein
MLLTLTPPCPLSLYWQRQGPGVERLLKTDNHCIESEHFVLNEETHRIDFQTVELRHRVWYFLGT